MGAAAETRRLGDRTGRAAPEEIEVWSDKMVAGSMMNNPEKRAYFVENCTKLGLNPEKSTTFDWLDADDRASFRNGPTPQPASN
jgi:hypothetical protein